MEAKKMRKVELRMNEEFKYQETKKLVENNGNKLRVAEKLGISVRQVNRLIIVYKEKGKEGFIHGNRSKTPVNKKAETLSNKIITLYIEKYKSESKNVEFNFSHFLDFLKDEEKICVSYSTLYNLLMKHDIQSPKIHKLTRKRIIKEKLAKNKDFQKMTKSEKEVVVNNIIAIEDAHPRKERKKYFGESIEMDASSFNWFGNTIAHLHLAVDNATGIVVGGYFDWQETLYGYYSVFRQILVNYGIPFAFKTDKRTVFTYKNCKMKKEANDVLTQFGYACHILGTELQVTSVPQNKAVVERLNASFQGRLRNELHFYNITTIEEANNYLINTFIPKYNKRFVKITAKSVFEKFPKDKNIDDILAVIAHRKIDTGHSFSFNSKQYIPCVGNEIVCFRKGTDVMIINTFDKRTILSINDKIYGLKEVGKNEKFSKVFDECIEVDKNNSRYKTTFVPAANHPWRSLKHLEWVAYYGQKYNKKAGYSSC